MEKLGGGFCWNIGGKCINFLYKKRAQLSVLSNEQRTLPEYFNTTSVLRPFFWDHPHEPVPEENFWTLWCEGRLTEADTQTTRLGATPARLTSAHLPHPEYFKCGKIAWWPGLCPGPSWGSLQRPPRPPSWWEGGWLPLSKNPVPALGPSSLEPRDLRPLFSCPLSTNPEYTSAKPLELLVFKLFIICTLVIVGNLALNKRTHGPDLR